MMTSATSRMAAPPSAYLPKGLVVDLRVNGFSEKAIVNADGSTKTVVYVTYSLPGRGDYLTISTPVDDMLGDLGEMDPGNLPQAVGAARQQIIKEAYDAWRSQTGRPVHGTALADWTALSQLERDILASVGFQTVEELARASDSRMARVRLPNAKGFRDLAQAEQASGNAARTDQVEAHLAQENRKLQSQIDELKAMLSQVLEQATQPASGAIGGDLVRRGPGRPRRDDAEAA